jgi:hypothetical protein
MTLCNSPLRASTSLWAVSSLTPLQRKTLLCIFGELKTLKRICTCLCMTITQSRTSTYIVRVHVSYVVLPDFQNDTTCTLILWTLYLKPLARTLTLRVSRRLVCSGDRGDPTPTAWERMRLSCKSLQKERFYSTMWISRVAKLLEGEENRGYRSLQNLAAHAWYYWPVLVSKADCKGNNPSSQKWRTQ